MSFPNPEPGLVISYAYLWHREHEAGLDEGRKDRPCVIILSVEKQDSGTQVTIAPITHSKPSGDTVGLEMPPRVKQHLRLDHETSWVIVSEVNQFIWPGYDMRPVAGKNGEYSYGFLPPSLFESIKASMLDLFVKRRSNITPRD